jgi:transcription termination factor NusA
MNAQSESPAEMLRRTLRISDALASKLIAGGISSPEEVAYVPFQQLREIGGLAGEEATSLRIRAREYLLAEATRGRVIAFGVVAHSILIAALWAAESCLDVGVPMGMYLAIAFGWLCWPVLALSNRSRLTVIALVAGSLIIAAPVGEFVSFVTCLDCRQPDFLCNANLCCWTPTPR